MHLNSPIMTWNWVIRAYHISVYSINEGLVALKKNPMKLGSIGGALIAAFRIFGISIMFLFSLVLHILFTNIKL